MKKRLRLSTIILILCFLTIPAPNNMAKDFKSYAYAGQEEKNTEDYGDEIEFTELWINGEKASYIGIPVVREVSSSEKGTDSKKRLDRIMNRLYILPPPG